MYTSILLPIDLSAEPSWKKAAPTAIQMARDYGAVVHVATVVPDFGMSVVGGYFSEDFEKDALHKTGEALNDWVAQHMPKDLEVHPHVLHGRVYDEIITAADRVGAEVIVMGSHRPELKDYLLGPNAARVVRHANQSVFVVRGDG